MDKTSAEAGISYQEKNRIIKECLDDPQKLRQMNDSMAATIGTEVYEESLARILLMPFLVPKDSCPCYRENENGPVVVVNFVQKEERILRCRAFRDSLREEEEVKTVRDIDFVAMRGQGVRPTSFPISNVCTVRRPELNGHAFALIERARQRMKLSLAMDETRVMLRALSWVCSRFGRFSWGVNAEGMMNILTRAIERIGSERNPVIVMSIQTLARAKGSRFRWLACVPGGPIPPKALSVGDRDYPIYVDQSMPDHAVYVVPSGGSLGQMSIFAPPRVENYDKPERLIKGWLCYQDQGMVFVNPRLTSVVYLGWRGLLEMMRNLVRRMFA